MPKTTKDIQTKHFYLIVTTLFEFGSVAEHDQNHVQHDQNNQQHDDHDKQEPVWVDTVGWDDAEIGDDQTFREILTFIDK